MTHNHLHPKYNSPYPSEVIYKSDKNFRVRLQAMIDREMASLGYPDDEQREKMIDNISRLSEETLFESKSPSSKDSSVLVEHLEDFLSAVPPQTDDADWWPDNLCKAVESAKKFLAQYNAVEPELWKSVEKDGYPEYNRGLIVCIPDEDYHITSGMWDRDNKWVLLDDYRVPDCPVTHYMLLPKLPKEFEKEVSQNDAVMEHLAKLLKMGKIKKPEALPSQSLQTPIDREPEEAQEDYLLDISTFAANNRYKSPTLKGETASFITDMPKVIEYIKSKYHITRK